MRVMFAKIRCPPFICFCKPSPHIYTPGPLKLENAPHPNPHVPSSKPDTSDQLPDDPIEIKEESVDENPKPPENSLEGAENSLKGNLRKPNSSDPAAPKEELKKRVQWMDFVGKELVEIKEFECSELDDTDNEDENRRGCICVIL